MRSLASERRLMTPTQRKLLTQELKRSDKVRLIACLLELADSIPEVWQALETRFPLEPRTTADLISRTQTAIARATDFDDREINRNFDYDSDAYEQVQKYFRQLVTSGQLEPVMELALELMSAGSYQVEMSDEGLMWHEIEACLDIVASAVERSEMAADRALLWCAQMEQNDRMGLYSRVRTLWTKSYPGRVWSAVADELISQLADGRHRDRPLSPRRREAMLRHAAHALDRAGRSSEISSLREFLNQPASPKRKRRSR